MFRNRSPISLITLSQFLKASKKMNKLQVQNCMASDIRLRTIDFLLVIFSENSTLEDFQFSFSEKPNVETTGLFKMSLNSVCKLMRFSAVCNTFVNSNIQEISLLSEKKNIFIY